MRILKAILCMLFIVGCRQSEGRFITYFKVDDVQNEQIAVTEDAESISRSQQDIQYTDRTTIVTTYKTSSPMNDVKEYYRRSMRDQGWEPHFVSAGAQDTQPDDLIFGKAGQDGGYPGDPIVFRNIIISIKTCGQKTCVTIKDILHPTIIPEGFN